MSNVSKEPYIFSLKFKNWINDFEKFKNNNDVSSLFKISNLKQYLEWFTYDFCLRMSYITLKKQKKSLVKPSNALEKLNKTPMPKLFKIIIENSKLLDDKYVKILHKDYWKNIIIKYYHHPETTINNNDDNELENIITIVYKLCQEFKNKWLNSEINFRCSIYDSPCHIKQNEIILCTSYADHNGVYSNIKNSQIDTAKITIKNFINNNILNSDQCVEILFSNKSSKVCFFCLKRLFGINPNCEDLSLIKTAALNHIKKLLNKTPYK